MSNQRRVACVILVSVLSGLTFGLPRAAYAQDSVNLRLCVETGYGAYGVTDHAHVEAGSGTYQISAFGQESGWDYYGTGAVCQAVSEYLLCGASVRLNIYEDGSYLADTSTYYDIGVHSVSTGNQALRK